MKFNSLQKNTFKVLASSSLIATGLLLSSNEEVQANCREDFGINPTSMNSSCEITPDKYEITVYEMGFCTADPLSGTNYDGATCSATFTSTLGKKINIAGNTVDLTGGETKRPSPGNYKYAYIKMSNTFGLNGTYKMNGTTYCSKNNGGSKSTAGCTGSDFEETLVDFSNGGTCSGSPEYSISVNFTTGVTGTMKAKLTDANWVTTTSCSSSPASSKRLVGTFIPDNAIVITDSTKGLEVDFTVTDTGMTVVPNGSGNAISSFGSGPFRPRFRSY